MTAAELKLATLRKLRVLAAGETADADDVTLMDEKYTGLHAMLLEMGLVTWALSEDIPPKAEQPVISMLAAMTVDDFGVSEPRASVLKAEGMLKLPQASIAERQLRGLLAPTPVAGTVQRAQYF